MPGGRDLRPRGPSEPVGFVGNTDEAWFRFLRGLAAEKARAGERLEEVNFWRPASEQEFHAATPGAPFFFRLKSPHNAIAGFGYFARAVPVPLTTAWEVFEKLNGAATFVEFRDSILSLRRRLRGREAASDPDPRITCLMISEPCFFEDANWVSQPADWSRNIVSGKAYSVVSGEGARLWADCRARECVGYPTTSGREAATSGVAEDARYGPGHLVRPRLGQGSFRLAVTDAYGMACAVTGEHSLPVLEAAHIQPFSEGGPHQVANGILLRADLHRLYDRGFVTVTPDLEFRVSPSLKERWGNGRSYDLYRGNTVSVPEDPADRPDRDLLERHFRETFLAT